MAHRWRETPDQAVVATQAGGREQELSSLNHLPLVYSTDPP
jgi:hypothetical protein